MTLQLRALSFLYLMLELEADTGYHAVRGKKLDLMEAMEVWNMSKY